MSAVEDSIDVRGSGGPTLISRVKNIILQPKLEWQAIDGESTTASRLYTSYIIPLSAIPPIASLIGMSVLGTTVPLIGTYRVPFGQALTGAIVRYVAGLIGVWVLALIIDMLAQTFGGQKNPVQALKVAAYAGTASWLAGIFALVPGLAIFGLLGLYSLYLLYLGLPVLMKSPSDKAMSYTVVVVICAIVIFVVVGGVAGFFVRGPSMGLIR